MAEVYTLTTVAGEVLRYSSIDIDVTHGGHVFLSDVLLIKRSKLSLKRGVEVDELTLDVTPKTATIGGVPFIAAIRNGALDGASLVLERIFYPAWGQAETGSLVIFSGKVSDIDPIGRTTATIKIKNLFELLNTKWPINIYMPACGRALYGPGCEASRETFRRTGTVGNGTTAALIKSPDLQPSGGTWTVNGVAWGGLIKTVGSDKDYETIIAALLDTNEDILLFVYAGSYTDITHDHLHLKGRRVCIKGAGELLTDVEIGPFFIEAEPYGTLHTWPSNVVIEWVYQNISGTSYQNVMCTMPLGAGITFQASKCILEAQNYYIFYYGEPFEGSVALTLNNCKVIEHWAWMFRQFQGARSANITMDRVWDASGPASWTGDVTPANFLVDDTLHQATEPVDYGPNYGDDVITYSIPAPFPNGYFNLGTITFTSGPNNGVTRTIKNFTSLDGVETVVPFEFTPQSGDTFIIYPGCDKQLATCGGVFGNMANFRGCPFIPSPESAA